MDPSLRFGISEKKLDYPGASSTSILRKRR
jgi:hypothetical protein